MRMRRALVILLPFLASGCGTAEPQAAAPKAHFTEAINAQSFYKGNIHTHSTQSDGNVAPAQVHAWYKKHGYSFVALTDHDKLVIEHRLDDHDFITLNGVELTGVATAGANAHVPVHVNAICGKSMLTGVRAGKPVAETANLQVRAAKADGAIALLNHPNYEWAFTPADLLAVDGFELLEIASGHLLVHEAGNDSHPSEEELWDSYLTQKHRVFGSGSDDAHNYTHFSETEEANPGRVWIQAWAPQLTSADLCEALRRGHFYVARDTKISALVVSPQTLELSVDKWQQATDHVDFIGAGGQLLDRVFSIPARYRLRGGEGYVRAHIFQAPATKDGPRREAWTQAYFIKNE